MKIFHKYIFPMGTLSARALLGWGIALVGPFAITAAQLRVSHVQTPFILYFIFVMVVARFFSMGPALLGTVLSTFLANYYLLFPVGELSFAGPSAHNALLFTLATTAAAVMLRSSLKRAARERGNAALARKLHEELQFERQKIDRALLQAPAAIVINGGADWRYEFINERAQDLMPPGQRALGMPLAAAMPALARDVIPLLDAVREQRAPMIVREYPLTLYINGSTERRLCDFTYQPIFASDGSVESVMTFCIDVHDAVLARHKLEALASERKENLRARDDFIAVAGHELKTPVAALLLQTQMLQRRLVAAKSESTTVIANAVERQLDSLGRLVRLIDTLLDVSRLSEGRMELRAEDVPVEDLLADVVSRLQSVAEQAGSTLRIVEAADITGFWDRLRLEQVLTNLISNAIKYGDGKPIEVYADEVDEHARFRVVDHGIGIRNEDQNRIFERFERIRDRQVGGLGLGLWITRRLVTAMGGSLSVTSSSGKGSIFTVWLPLADQGARDASGERSAEDRVT